MTRVPVALGIDFERIMHTPAYRGTDDTSDVDTDLAGVTNQLLDLFRRYDVAATFFIVAEIAENKPDLIRGIEAEGHEIASHTINHYTLPELDTAAKRTEIAESKSIIESVIEGSVSGFRAPTCCLDDEVFELLCETGYDYSSSVMPPVPVPGFYSNDYDYDTPTMFDCGKRNILEFPLSLSPVSGLPVSGAWIRLLGRTRFLRSIDALASSSQPVLTYSHPWEFTDQGETNLPFRCRFRSGEWLFETYQALLGRDLEFVTVREMAERTTPIERHVVSC